jgi:hypothetical protein
MSRLARQGRVTFATWATRATDALRPSLAGVKSRSVVLARRGGSELPAVAVPRRRCSTGSLQGKGVVAHRHVAAWMWSCCSSFRQAIVMAEVRSGRVVARGCRRRRSFAVVRVPSQDRSFFRMVAREASPGVRSSRRSRPGRCAAKLERCASLSCSAASRRLVAVAAAGPPEADHCTAAAGEFVDSLEGPRFASRRRKYRAATTGTGAGSASDRARPVPRCLEGVVPAEV